MFWVGNMYIIFYMYIMGMIDFYANSMVCDGICCCRHVDKHPWCFSTFYDISTTVSLNYIRSCCFGYWGWVRNNGLITFLPFAC